MFNLSEFLKFDWESFSEGKEFAVTGCSKWSDFNTGEHLGTKVNVVISKDETAYAGKNGANRSNLYERITFKVKSDVQIPANSHVVPVNPVVKAYGMDRNGKFSQYLNRLSIECDSVDTV